MKQGQPFEIKMLPAGWWFGPITTIGRRGCHDCQEWIPANTQHWYRTNDGFICNACEDEQRPHTVMMLCPDCRNWKPEGCQRCAGVGYVTTDMIRQAATGGDGPAGGAG